MRVWDIENKRWGDSKDERWVLEWYHLDKPVGEHDCVWDFATCNSSWWKTKAQALKAAKSLTSNVVNVATVRKAWMEQVEGDSWGWEFGEPEDVEIAYVEPANA